MKIRANSDGTETEVKILMSHPMETGRRKDEDGNPVPAHFIRNITVTHGDVVVLSAQWGPAISANPFLSFRFRGGVPGEMVKVAWRDNLGDTKSQEAMIA
ncbi:MAG: thiosulfate oxidation carrier complex protein SoxZ [Betaproteobacteria bacterium]|nr:thiosulfate oxidation carrier complex protein SoxZ [Betaproteobacteria bacterium]